MYRDKFNWFSGICLSIVSIAIATQAIIFSSGEDIMTQAISPYVIGILVIAGIAGIFAIYYGLKMGSEPKDTRLDTLITQVSLLTSAIHQLEVQMAKFKPEKELTKDEFERLLKKAAQPVSSWSHDQAESETSESHPSDGCNGKRRNQDKTEGKED